MLDKKKVLEALSRIIDPDLGKDIVSLGFIANLEIRKGHVLVDIRITTPACPVRDEFKSKAEDYIGAIDDVQSVTVTISSNPENASEGIKSKAKEGGLQKVGSLIAVASCKGGVGKSTVAAALARELANRGHSVGLLDADIFGPSVPSLFDCREVELESGPGNTIIPVDVNGVKLVSFGFWLGDSPAVMRGPMVTNYIQQLLHGVSWGHLDYLFLDMPPGTGDIQLTITQSVKLSGAVVVTTPQPLSLIDVGKGILMFDKVSVPLLGVIENMAYFEVEGIRHAVFGSNGGDTLRERFGVDTIARLPLDPKKFGKTFVETQSLPEISHAVDQMIRSLGRSTISQDEVSIDFNQSNVILEWLDGRKVSVSNRLLRQSCRCAHCINEFTGEKMTDNYLIPEDIKASEVRSVGNYAMAITWSDGHSTGLFPYSVVAQMGEAVEA